MARSFLAVLFFLPLCLQAEPADLSPWLAKSAHKNILADFHKRNWQQLAPAKLEFVPHEKAPYIKDKGVRLRYLDSQGRLLLAYDWFFEDGNVFNVDTELPEKAAPVLANILRATNLKNQMLTEAARDEGAKQKEPFVSTAEASKSLAHVDWVAVLGRYLKEGRLISLRPPEMPAKNGYLFRFSPRKTDTALPKSFRTHYPKDERQTSTLDRFVQVKRDFSSEKFTFSHEFSGDATAFGDQMMLFPDLSTKATYLFWRPGSEKVEIGGDRDPEINGFIIEAIRDTQEAEPWLRGVLQRLFPDRAPESVPLGFQSEALQQQTCRVILKSLASPD